MFQTVCIVDGLKNAACPLTYYHKGTPRCTVARCYMFLPKRYFSVFTNQDIKQINEEKLNLHLVYKGECEKRRALDLSLEHVEK
jgi:hypothetical protein